MTPGPEGRAYYEQLVKPDEATKEQLVGQLKKAGRIIERVAKHPVYGCQELWDISASIKDEAKRLVNAEIHECWYCEGTQRCFDKDCAFSMLHHMCSPCMHAWGTAWPNEPIPCYWGQEGDPQ